MSQQESYSDFEKRMAQDGVLAGFVAAPSGRRWTPEQNAYYDDLYREQMAMRLIMREWLREEAARLGAESLYSVWRFTWGSLALFIPQHYKGREICALHLPLFAYNGHVHFLSAKEMDDLSDLAGRFGDKFGYRLRTDTIWSDKTTHLFYVVKPKFDPRRSGVN